MLLMILQATWTLTSSRLRAKRTTTWKVFPRSLNGASRHFAGGEVVSVNNDESWCWRCASAVLVSCLRQAWRRSDNGEGWTDEITGSRPLRIRTVGGRDAEPTQG